MLKTYQTIPFSFISSLSSSLSPSLSSSSCLSSSRLSSSLSSSLPHSQSHSLTVALTRDRKNNQKLSHLLSERGIQCVDLPCIEFHPGTDQLTHDHLTQSDVIVVTSPQGASVLGKSWEENGRPELKIASIGKGTSARLSHFGLRPIFQPSISTAEYLGKELPLSLGNRILYPTSQLADTLLEDRLKSRGFTVTRLNSYQTLSPSWSENEMKLAKAVDIVTFSSPSAVEYWTKQVGSNAVAVVIGPTTEKAAKKKGFQEIYSNEIIELDSLVDLIERCAEKQKCKKYI